MTMYEQYDVLCQWNKETEIVIKYRKLSPQIVVTCFFPSPSRRPLLVFSDLIFMGAGISLATHTPLIKGVARVEVHPLH